MAWLLKLAIAILITQLTYGQNTVHIYKDCLETSTHFCIGSKNNKTSYGRVSDKGCVSTKDCQLMIHVTKNPTAKSLSWKLCALFDNTIGKHAYMKVAVTNIPISLVKTKSHVPKYPKEILHLSPHRTSSTQMTTDSQIYHEEPSPDPLPSYLEGRFGTKSGRETLSLEQTKTNFIPQEPQPYAVDQESHLIYECYNYKSGYFATLTDALSSKLSYVVNFNEPVQINTILWLFDLGTTNYELENLIEDQPLINLFTEEPEPMRPVPVIKTTTRPVITTQKPDETKPIVVPTETARTTQAAENGATEKPQKEPSKKEDKKHKTTLLVIIIVVVILALVIIAAVGGFCYSKNRKSKADRRAAEAARRLRLIKLKVNHAADSPPTAIAVPVPKASPPGNPDVSMVPPKEGKTASPYSVITVLK